MIRNGEWGFNLVFSEKMKGEDQGYKGDILRKKGRGEHLGDSREKKKRKKREKREERKGKERKKPKPKLNIFLIKEG